MKIETTTSLRSRRPLGPDPFDSDPFNEAPGPADLSDAAEPMTEAAAYISGCRAEGARAVRPIKTIQQEIADDWEAEKARLAAEKDGACNWVGPLMIPKSLVLLLTPDSPEEANNLTIALLLFVILILASACWKG